MTFRQALCGGDSGLVRAIGAHHPLGARLAEEAGFDAIWASGFELSAAYGLPDASLITMTQHLEATRAMVAAVAIPVVADLDTGFGNAINVMHAVDAYRRAGAAAVVIEDKRFPKDTSLLAGGRQELVSAAAFAGKIEAAIAARGDDEMAIIARTEALIAGRGQAEAKARAEAYVAAGADAILVHSKARTPDEILAFVAAWERDTPLVVVPTAYPQLGEGEIAALGKIGMVIYGNHGLRAMVTALETTFARIRRDGGAHNVERDIAPVDRVFDLQGVPRMKAAEKKFLR